MKTSPPDPEYGKLLRWALTMGRYYGLFLLGLITTCIVSAIVGFFPLIDAFLFTTGEWLFRVAASVVALIVSSCVVESFRH